jgi:predicted house-cleaning NTP pyrophosphatase (Maf/HAM1 superfamily)
MTDKIVLASQSPRRKELLKMLGFKDFQIVPADMEEILRTTSDLKTAATKLVEKANSNGGPDNITVVLAKVMGTS